MEELNLWIRILFEKLTGFQLRKKFPLIFGDQKVHNHNHKGLPPVPILSQVSPFHTIHFCFLNPFYYYPLIYAHPLYNNS